jgi:glyoxylase-like metal-dependent hydrolase (beta-lactamase superfamily II)
MTTHEFSWLSDPAWLALRDAAREDSSHLPFFTYQSSHDPYLTCSYYFESECGVVLIDTQMFRSSVEELWAEIQQNTSGNLCTIINTHAHPDHINGNGFLRRVAPQVKIITSEAVATDILTSTPPRIALTRSHWGDEVPGSMDDYPPPDLTFTGTLTLKCGEITIHLFEHGAAEAPVQVTAWIPQWRALATADILQNKQHHYVADGAVLNWCVILDELESHGADWYLTGHQGVGGRELLPETKRWMSCYLGLMAAESGAWAGPLHGDLLPPHARRRVIEGLKRQFPDWYDPCMLDERESVLEFCMNGRQSEVLGREFVEHGFV